MKPLERFKQHIVFYVPLTKGEYFDQSGSTSTTRLVYWDMCRDTVHNLASKNQRNFCKRKTAWWGKKKPSLLNRAEKKHAAKKSSNWMSLSVSKYKLCRWSEDAGLAYGEPHSAFLVSPLPPLPQPLERDDINKRPIPIVDGHVYQWYHYSKVVKVYIWK